MNVNQAGRCCRSVLLHKALLKRRISRRISPEILRHARGKTVRRFV